MTLKGDTSYFPLVFGRLHETLRNNTKKDISKYYVDETIPHPKLAVLKCEKDFDNTKHNCNLIEFMNKEDPKSFSFILQYIHNPLVLARYYEKRFPNQPITLYNYIIVPKNSKEIKICIGNIILNQINLNWIKMRDEFLDVIHPDISMAKLPDIYETYFIDTYGINDNKTIKCLCDDVEVKIHFIKHTYTYDVMLKKKYSATMTKQNEKHDMNELNKIRTISKKTNISIKNFTKNIS